MSDFPWPPGDKGRGPGAREQRVRSVREDSFLTYQPIMSCPFCARDISMEGYTPPDTALVCPHTRKAECDALLTRLSTQPEAVKHLSYRSETLRDGSVLVTVLWAEILPGGAPAASTTKTEETPRRPPRVL